jgi:hypothetical protein
LTGFEVSAEGLVEDYYGSAGCGGFYPGFFHEYSILIEMTCGSEYQQVAGSTTQPAGGGSLYTNGGIVATGTVECVINFSMLIYCTALPGLILEEYVSEQVTAGGGGGCSVTITEETISPGTVGVSGPLPVRNPARIRRFFAPVFEATLSPPTCPISWSIASGSEFGSIIGSTTSPLVTVYGNSVGTIQLKAATSGGVSYTLPVPVVNQQNVNLKVRIFQESNGSNPAVTEARVAADIAKANAIWVQCGIQFTLQPIDYLDSSLFLNPDATYWGLILDLFPGDGAIEIYYAKSFPDSPLTLGVGNKKGSLIQGDAAFDRTPAHELGHTMGDLLDSGTIDLHLMAGQQTSANTSADIKLDECIGSTRFVSE